MKRRGSWIEVRPNTYRDTVLSRRRRINRQAWKWTWKVRFCPDKWSGQRENHKEFVWQLGRLIKDMPQICSLYRSTWKSFFFFFELLNWVQLRSIELVGKAEVDKKKKPIWISDKTSRVTLRIFQVSHHPPAGMCAITWDHQCSAGPNVEVPNKASVAISGF